MKKARIFFATVLMLCIMLSISASAARPIISNIWERNPAETLYLVDKQVAESNPNAKEIYPPTALSSDISGATLSEKELRHVIDNSLVVNDEGISPVVSKDIKEVYLEPEQIGDNMYIYTDEEGQIVALLNTEPDFMPDMPPRAAASTVWQFDWSVPANSVTHGSADLGPGTGLTTVYVKSIFEKAMLTYIGYYHTGNSTYYWLTPPSTTGFNGSFYFGASHAVRLAMKNDSNVPNRYWGKYSLSAFTD